MFLRCISLISIMFFPLAFSQADEAKQINVLLSCPQGDESLKGFLSFVKKQLKLPADTTTGLLQSEESLSVATPQIEIVEQSDFTRLSVPVENVLAYLLEREAQFAKITDAIEAKNSPKPPQSVWEVFYEFQMMTAGECDFLIPTRTKFLDKKALKSL